MQEQLYSIHGVAARLLTDSAAIAAAGQRFLHHFEQERLDGPSCLDLIFHGVRRRAGVPIEPSPAAELLFSRPGAGEGVLAKWECDLYRDQGQILVDFHEQGLMRIETRQDRVEGFIVEPEAMHPDLRVSFLYLGLAELLKRRGLYSIHATALEKGGRGVLIPGLSGQGKTTCCISLLRAGYRCLSDDHPFFRRNGLGLELLSFPVKVDVTPKTVQFFPELRQASEHLHQGLQKQYFHLHDLFPSGIAESCHPAVLLFPQIIDWPQSYLEPLPRGRALQELLRHSLLVLDEEIARRQFHHMADLVETVACYRLHFGEDILDLPRLIDPLLAPEGVAVGEGVRG
jgi:hypothetical protein